MVLIALICWHSREYKYMLAVDGFSYTVRSAMSFQSVVTLLHIAGPHLLSFVHTPSLPLSLSSYDQDSLSAADCPSR